MQPFSFVFCLLLATSFVASQDQTGVSLTATLQQGTQGEYVVYSTSETFRFSNSLVFTFTVSNFPSTIPASGTDGQFFIYSPTIYGNQYVLVVPPVGEPFDFTLNYGGPWLAVETCNADQMANLGVSSYFCNAYSLFGSFAGINPNGEWAIGFYSTLPANSGTDYVGGLTVGWANNVASRLPPNCPPLLNDNNANWETAVANSLSYGTCLYGYVGHPSRQCQSNGVLSSTINNPCISVSSIQCQGQTYANAEWTASGLGTWTGTCISGWTGTPTRVCQTNSVWSTYVNPPCTAVIVNCPAQTVGNTTYPIGYPNAVAHLTCGSGYYGTPTSLCQSDGTWGSIQNPCQPIGGPCPAEQYGQQTFPETQPGQIATGTCIGNANPYHGAGSPTRLCYLSGTWDPDVPNICLG